MKSLFNKYESYNTYGGEVSDEIQKALDPIFEKWARKGYKVNDVESIAIDIANVTSAFIRLDRSMRMVKARRKAI